MKTNKINPKFISLLNLSSLVSFFGQRLSRRRGETTETGGLLKKNRSNTLSVPVAVLLGVLLTLSPRGLLASTDEEHFNNSMDYTRGIDEKGHFIGIVQIDFNLKKEEPKEQNLEFQYDRYPDLERLKIKDGATYARKQRSAWRESIDWGETGKEVSEEQVGEINAMISMVNAPFTLGGNSGTGMKLHGDLIVELVKRKPFENGDLLIYQMRRNVPREKGSAYPTFVFVKNKNQSEDKTELVGFEGPMTLSGTRAGKGVWVTTNYRRYIVMPHALKKSPGSFED